MTQVQPDFTTPTRVQLGQRFLDKIHNETRALMHERLDKYSYISLVTVVWSNTENELLISYTAVTDADVLSFLLTRQVTIHKEADTSVMVLQNLYSNRYLPGLLRFRPTMSILCEMLCAGHIHLSNCLVAYNIICTSHIIDIVSQNRCNLGRAQWSYDFCKTIPGINACLGLVACLV